MATIKFDLQDELDELNARLYLDSKIKFTKKELLELIFKLGIQDYNLLLKKIKKLEGIDNKELRKKFIDTFSASLSISDSEISNPKSIWVKEIRD